MLGYSSDVSFQMNAGGALGDLNWLDEGDVADGKLPVSLMIHSLRMKQQF